MRILRLLRLFLGFSLQSQLEYRADIVANLVSILIGAGTSLLAIYSLFSATGGVGGWSLAEGIVLYGVAQILVGCFECWLYPSLQPITEYVRKGDFDLILLRPLDSQFFVSVRHWQVWQLPSLIIGLAAVIYGADMDGSLSLANLLLFAILLLSGLAILYSLYLGCSSLAFWFTRVEDISNAIYFVFSVGYVPIAAFPPWARFVLTFLLPVAFITNVPAQAATGRLTWPLALGGLAAAGLSLVLVTLLWRRAIRSYSGASS